MNAKKIAFIQPIITSYRVEFFRQLSKRYDLDVVACKPNKKEGFNTAESYPFNTLTSFIKFKFGRFFYQTGLLKLKHPVILSYGNLNNIALWLLLLKSSLFTGQKVILHGQGLYNGAGFVKRLMYKAALSLADAYVCYNAFSRDETIKVLPLFKMKLHYASNTLFLNTSLSEKELTDNSERKDILYVGRLRNDCGLDLLIEALQQLKSNSNNNIRLKVIGEGELFEEYKKKYCRYNNIVFLGAIYEEEEILKVSKTCFCGIYPGDAGLSVVHYMSMGLPIIVHDSFNLHMGPEPAYVKEGQCGVFFERNNALSMARAIDDLVNLDAWDSLAKNSLNKYKELNGESVVNAFSNVINEV
jgi:glycosyltransferase involved in cell wall biosynthesis